MAAGTTTTASVERSVCASHTNVQKVITKYGLAAHLAILAVAPLFLSESAILWIAALVAVCVIMEPSRVGSEMLHDARQRVSRALVRDPLFWVGILLMGVAALRSLNSGVALVYDAEVAKWSLSSPNLPILPGCTAGVGGWHFALACAGFVLVMGCRHALGRSARSAFSLVASFLAGVVSLVRLISERSNPETLAQMSNCSSVDPIYEGCAYGIFAVFAIVSLAMVFARRWWRAIPLAVIGLCGSIVGVFFFAPAYCVVLFLSIVFVTMLYIFVYLRIKVSKTADFKCLVVSGLAVAFAVMIAMSIAPDSLLQEKIAPFLTGNFLGRELMAARETLSRISFEVWHESPWLGTGLGSFPVDMSIHAHPADWKVVTSLQTAPLNGYWLVLAERGVVGAFFLVIPLAILLSTYVRRFVGGLKSLPGPLVWLFPLLLVAGGVGMMVDCSFLSPKVLLPFLAALSISANDFVKENGRNVK